MAPEAKAEARAQVAAAGLQQHAAVPGLGGHARVACQHQLYRLGGDGAIGQFVQCLQHLQGACGPGLGAIDLELLVPVGDADLERGLEGAQVRVHRAAQVLQPRVVVGGEVVSDDQADNPGKAFGWAPANPHDRHSPAIAPANRNRFPP